MNIRLKAITVLLAVAPAFGATAQTVSEIETSGRYYHARDLAPHTMRRQRTECRIC